MNQSLNFQGIIKQRRLKARRFYQNDVINHNITKLFSDERTIYTYNY